MYLDFDEESENEIPNISNQKKGIHRNSLEGGRKGREGREGEEERSEEEICLEKIRKVELDSSSNRKGFPHVQEDEQKMSGVRDRKSTRLNSSHRR